MNTPQRRATKGYKAREELVQSLEQLPHAKYEEENGALIKRVTQVQVLEAVQVLGKNQEAMAKFLLHLDDRIVEQNGYRPLIEETQETIKKVQVRVEEICSEREMTCPNTKKIAEIKDKIDGHLNDEEKEALVAGATGELREKLIKQGSDEAERRFKRITGMIGATVAVVGITITIAAFIINNFL